MSHWTYRSHHVRRCYHYPVAFPIQELGLRGLSETPSHFLLVQKVRAQMKDSFTNKHDTSPVQYCKSRPTTFWAIKIAHGASDPQSSNRQNRLMQLLKTSSFQNHLRDGKILMVHAAVCKFLSWIQKAVPSQRLQVMQHLFLTTNSYQQATPREKFE